ncbi:hypothetical protein F183_A20550 [Bryobacterales bacterium F-183]|nr:hypothetical protein F183_A20550 [Bryobacterales bacterium F-183]
MSRATVILLHWKSEEIPELIPYLGDVAVVPYAPVTGEGMKGLATYAVPDALVVSLDRMPSHGQAVAWHYQARKATRHVPVVFAGGEPEKVAKAREVMPHALFCSWKTAAKTVQKAIANPPVPAVTAPKAPVSNRPMAEKLGLKAGIRVALIGAPMALERLVPGMDFELDVVEEPDARTEAVWWFVRSAEEVADGFEWIVPRLGKKPKIWVFYRKGKSLTWQGLSEAAAMYGLAQFKILSLNAEWTGVALGQARKSAAG